jgi:hypothetical protein
MVDRIHKVIIGLGIAFVAFMALGVLGMLLGLIPFAG